MEKPIRKPGYAELTQRATLAEVVAFSKAEFGKVLLDEDSFSESE